MTGELAPHWDASYANGADRVSWAQSHATVSLELIAELGVAHDAPVIDVGGGASPLTGELLDRGFADLTVLDISALALQSARERLGERAAEVAWIEGDLRHWRPARRYGLWHDRAVLHFLTDPGDQAAYATLAADTVAPGGHAIIATFAPDGPERCSGLPVVRYAPEDLAALLGERFAVVADRREAHHTPGGAVQQFSWIAARRR